MKGKLIVNIVGGIAAVVSAVCTAISMTDKTVNNIKAYNESNDNEKIAE